MKRRRRSRILAWILTFSMLSGLTVTPVSATESSLDGVAMEQTAEITADGDIDLASDSDADEITKASDSDADEAANTDETDDVDEEAEIDLVDDLEKASDSDAEEVLEEEESAVDEIQTLIDALPTVDEVSAMSTEEQNEVYTQVSEIWDAYYELSEAEQALVDTTALEELSDYFNGLTALAEDAVAQVGENTYTSLSEAIEAANEGDTVQLLADYDAAGTPIVISKGITLDLNGHTVSSSSTLSNIIKVSGGTESVPVMITDNQANDHLDAGTVITLCGISVGTGYTQIEKINIETELKDYQNAAGIYCAATSAVLTVKGVNIAVESTSSIDNPVLSGVYVAAGKATVLLMDDDDAESFPMKVSVKASSGTVQAVYNAYDTSNVSIYGGYYEVSSTKTKNSATLNIVSKNSGCSIYDGYFLLKDTEGVTITKSLGTAVAYGGYYNFEPDSNSIGADYASYSLDENDDAHAEGYTYRVDLAADYVVSNATQNVYYSTLQAAIDAAESGDTIQLLASIEENVTIDSNQNIVLDLNGYTLEKTIGSGDLNPVESPVITVEGTLELQDSSSDESGMVLMSSYTDSYGDTYSRSGGYGGGVYIKDGGSVTLTGGTISSDGAAMTIEGGGVAVASGGAFTMNGGAITGFKVSSAGMDGGGVYVAGTFTMNGGSIKDNESGTGDGGGVYVTSGGSFTLTDGVISGNSAHDFGAGVFNNGTFVMSGGSIKDNSVTHTDGDGGGVFNAMSGVFTISGGSITGNSDVVSGTLDCGGVYNDGTMNVSGSPVIANNVMNNSVACNVYLTYNSYITLADALTEGASIGVTTQEAPTEGSPVQITTAESGTSYYASSISYFTSDNDAYVISTNESGYLQLGYEEKAYVAQIFDTLLGDSGTKYETLQEAIDAAGSDAYFTTVKLLTYVDEGITVATGQEVILDLNGFDLTNSDASVNSGYAIDVEGGTLTLDDGAGGSVITGSGDYVVKIHSTSSIGTASFTMNGATISGGAKGGIYIAGGSSNYKSTVIINGGSISNNSGNGIYANYATITMNDGSITGNGRGLYLSQYSTLTMNGGSISNNSTSNVGGGVCMSSNSSYNNKFVMNGGVITGNTASIGGGVYAVTRNNAYYFQMNGGAIYGNIATSSGNDIYATNVNAYTNATILNAADMTDVSYTAWRSDADGTMVTDTTTLSGTVYLTAVDGSEEYDTLTVTYDANKATGTAPSDTNAYTSGMSVTVTAGDELTNEGYYLSGWNTAADGSGTAYAVGDTFIITENTTLYAQWSELVANLYDSEGVLLGSYSSLSSAVSAVTNSKAYTIVLQKDFSTEDEIEIIPITSRNVTIDLNGHTYTYVGESDYAIQLNGTKYTLTVTDSSTEGSGKIAATTAGSAAITVLRGTLNVTGNVTLSGTYVGIQAGAYTSAYTASTVCKVNVSGNAAVTGGTLGITVVGSISEKTGDAYGPVLTVSGGTISGDMYGISGNGDKEYYGSTTICVEGGTITGDVGIYHPQAGTITISDDAEINGTTSGVQMCSGDLTVSGGTITVTGGGDTSGKTGDGSIPDGAAISVVNRSYPAGTPTAEITEGTFVSSANVAAVQAYTWSSDSSSEWEEAGTYVNISGGHFSSDLADTPSYIADGYAAYTEEENTEYYTNGIPYTVKEATTVTVYYGETAYELNSGESYDLTQPYDATLGYGIPDGYLYAGLFSDEDYTTAVTDCGTGVAFTPEADGTYYVKTVSDSYFQIKCLYSYIDNKINSLWPILGIDDDKYASYGFVINGDENVLEASDTAYEQVTIELEGSDSTSKTCSEAFGVKGYVGVLKLDSDTLSGYAEEGTIILTMQPYFVTLDGVMVTGVVSRTVTFENGYAGAGFSGYTDTTVTSTTKAYEESGSSEDGDGNTEVATAEAVGSQTTDLCTASAGTVSRSALNVARVMSTANGAAAGTTVVPLGLNIEEEYVITDGGNTSNDGNEVKLTHEGSDTKYATLEEAIAAAKSGDVITLLSDVTVETLTEIKSSQNITLDLASYTISGEMSTRMFAVSGTLTIKASGDGKIVNNGSSNAISNGGTLIIESGTIASNTYAVYNTGTLTVNGGTVTGGATGTSYALYLAGGTITINGGTFTSTNQSIGAVRNNAVLTINGGTIGDITDDLYGVYNAGTVTVNGGTLSGSTAGLINTTSGSTVTVNDGVLQGGKRGLYNSTGTADIYGGTFTGNTEYGLMTNSPEINVSTVYAGTFNGGSRAIIGYRTNTIAEGSGFTSGMYDQTSCVVAVVSFPVTLVYADGTGTTKQMVSFDSNADSYDLTQYVPNGYLYGGLYTDEACTSAVDSSVNCGVAFTYSADDTNTYYMKLVNDAYFRVKCLYAYKDNSISSLWPIIGIDSDSYYQYGFLINGDEWDVDVEEGKRIYNSITIDLEGQEGTKSTCQDAFGVTGYLGVLKMDADTLSIYETEAGTISFTIRPFFVTTDGVMVTGVVSRTVTFKEGEVSSSFTGYDDETVASETSPYSYVAYLNSSISTASLEVESSYVLEDAQD